MRTRRHGGGCTGRRPCWPKVAICSLSRARGRPPGRRAYGSGTQAGARPGRLAGLAAGLAAIGKENAVADADDVRRLALALPHVEEIDSDGFDFRVAGKGFVWSYPERRPGKPRLIRTDIAVLFVGDEAEKQALLLGEPRLFFTAPGYDGWPLVMLRLAEVEVERLR